MRGGSMRAWERGLFRVADAWDRRAARHAARTDPAPRADFRVIAHRGASASAPENTIPAFREALAQGAREVELDVQLARDGEVFVFHDERLEAKTGARGALRDRDSAALRALEIGSWFDARRPRAAAVFAGTPLATLADVFESFGARLRYQIEIKTPDASLPDRSLAVIDRFGLRSHVTLTSFHAEPLARVRTLAADVPTCALIRTPRLLRPTAPSGAGRGARRGRALLRGAVEAAASAGAGAVALPVRWLAPGLVADARSFGLGVRAWRVRDETDLDQAVDAGADGATVDWPGRALAHLARRGVGPDPETGAAG